MFILKKLNNNSGVIMVTIILLTIVLSVTALGIMSANISQVKSTQSVIEEIKAEQLASGAFYVYQQHLNEGCVNCTNQDCSLCPTIPTETLDEKAYSVLINGTGFGPYATDEITVSVTY